MRRLYLMMALLTFSGYAIAQTSGLDEEESGENGVFEITTANVMDLTHEVIDSLIAIDQFDKHAYDEAVEAIHETTPIVANEGGRSTCDCYTPVDETYTQITQSQFSPSSLDGSFGPISMPFTYNHYGASYNQFYVSTKGVISFAPFADFTPEAFPGSSYNLVAGYWADIDIRQIGEVYYKVTDDAVYVNFVNVGYYFLNTDKTNTFQMIITDGESPVLGEGNNVAFCYDQMEWAQGDWGGGSGGANNPDPATVGADKSFGNQGVQFGRFNLLNDNYDGPYGAQDGVDWLDFRSIIFSSNTSDNNVPPVPTTGSACDTLFLCLNDTATFDLSFLSPESSQTTTITVDDTNADGFQILEVDEGSIATLTGLFVGTSDNQGTHELIITATDDGSPAQSTSITYIIQVLDITLPTLTIEGDPLFCAGSAATLTATEGFDTYSWNTGCTTNVCDVDDGGEVLLTASLAGCEASASIFVDETAFFLPFIDIVGNPICSDDSSEVTVQSEYDSYFWEPYQNFPGEVYGPDDEQTANLAAGTYRVVVTDSAGCQGQRIFNIEGIDSYIPEDEWSGIYCEGLEPVEFDGGYNNPGTGNLSFYMFSNSGSGWQGSYLSLIIDGDTIEGEFFTTLNQFTIDTYQITFGQYIEVVYNDFGGPTNTVTIFNCSNQNQIELDNLEEGVVWEGYAGCTSDPAVGTWELVSGPGGTFGTTEEFNTDFTPDDFGTYELCFLEESCGIEYCYDIEFNLPPTVNLSTQGDTICPGDEVELMANVDDPLDNSTVFWNDNLGSDPNLTVSEPGTYTITVENACASVSDSAVISILDQPVVELQDYTICQGETVTLDPVAGDDSGLTYLWEGDVDDPEDPEITVGEGEYTVTVSTGCEELTATSTVDLLAALEPQIVAPPTGCEGNSITLQMSYNGSGSVTWDDSSTGNTLSVSSDGTYCGTVENECETAEACHDIDFIQEPVITAVDEGFVICPGISETISVQVAGAEDATIGWTSSYSEDEVLGTGQNFTVNSANFPQSSLDAPIIFTANAVNACGSDQAEIIIIPDPCDITYPNIISPNNDNINDELIIQGSQNFNDVVLRVFDRWGKLVYEDADYQNDWGADDQGEGTYYYIVELPNGDSYSGYLTIVR
ncbi:T9SS type B sorting domain-containing protein [Halocola ammonii]